jgi:L-ascorbate metabolism protein UlaG (beta-lactamase superfamily)
LSELTWLGHSTVVIEVDGTRLITDPVLRERIWHLRRATPVDHAALGALDGILVSHAHLDHLDLASLDRLDRLLPVVVPVGVGRAVRRRGFERVFETRVGEELELGAVRVRATHAEHDGRRRPLAPRTDSLGYVVTGSSQIYFAGDTDLFDGMRELGPLDAALLPVAGWGPRLPPGHLDPEGAAEALRLLRPRIAVPIHWGTFRTPFARDAGTGPARAFVEAAARVAPEVDVRVVGIGESLALEAARP